MNEAKVQIGNLEKKLREWNLKKTQKCKKKFSNIHPMTFWVGKKESNIRNFAGEKYEA